MVVRRILACAVFALAGGCSILTSLDGLSSRNDDQTPTPGGSDGAAEGSATGDGASASDAPSDTGPTDDVTVDSGTDSGPSLPNLHPNGNFEANIMPWGAYQGVVTQNDLARTGAHSLRACGSNGLDFYTADDGSALASPVIGATYRAEAWVRTSPGAAAPPSMTIFLRSVNFTGGFQSVETADVQAASAITSTWQKLTVTITITKAAERFGIFVGADPSAGGCFLLDDVVLQRIN